MKPYSPIRRVIAEYRQPREHASREIANMGGLERNDEKNRIEDWRQNINGSAYNRWINSDV